MDRESRIIWQGGVDPFGVDFHQPVALRLTPALLGVTDQRFLLGGQRNHRWATLEELLDRGPEGFELLVAIRVGRSLAWRAMGLQAVAPLLQQRTRPSRG